jgi:hypothetical protein
MPNSTQSRPRFFLRPNLILVVVFFAVVLIQGCSGSGGGESGEVTTSNLYDPSRDYYDQLWDMAKQSLTPDMTEAEIAEALARWVVNNSTNARWVPEDSTYPLPDLVRGSDDFLLPFHGLCQSRSLLFQDLGQRAGLTVSVFNIYNFGSQGLGHACVQVYYENDWHFYDVTYAGIFKVNGEVISFAEIRADPNSALEGMIVFEPEGEIRDYHADGVPMDNVIRMHSIYTETALANANSTSFFDSGNLVPLEVKFDLGLLPIQLGDPDGTNAELSEDGTNQRVTVALGVMLGNVFDNFQPTLMFRNAIPGQSYMLKFYIYYVSGDTELPFRVTSLNDIEIISGGEIIASNEMLELEESLVWEIVFRAKAEEGSFTIQHTCEPEQGLYLNQVTIETTELER